MAELEPADKMITLTRAAEIAGLSADTLRDAAREGRLGAEMPGNEYLTTRRWLHRYLAGRKRGVVKPLPPNYPQVEGEEPIP